MVDGRNSTPARSPTSDSPPPVVLPARVAALKDPTTIQRRKSLPARTTDVGAGAGLGAENKRKRHPASKSRSPPKRAMPKGKPLSMSFSDSDSDPLSELSSESESESEDEQTPSQPSTPASPASTVASASTSTPSVRKITLNVTSKRASTRVIPPKKPPTRTSARLSHVVVPGPDPAQPVVESVPVDIEVSPPPSWVNEINAELTRPMILDIRTVA